MDPQGNATSGLGVSKDDIELSLYDCLADSEKTKEAIVKTACRGLSIIPSLPELSAAEIELASEENREFFVKEALKEVKNDYDFIDLNGITGDFTPENPYKGLDEFKLGFNPYAFEYIGEYDFIINDSLYKVMEQNGQLAKEFNKPEKSTNK